MLCPSKMHLEYYPLRIPTMEGENGVKIELANKELWDKFHQADTEMVITKLGRRMFPHLKIRISGLKPDELYILYIELELQSEHRYRYSGAKWTTAGRAEPQPPQGARRSIHPDGISKGSHWMQKEINFQKAKLTNSAMGDTPHIILSSMHKYIPRVVISKALNNGMYWPVCCAHFPETDFIAVTAYQNPEITKLKIDYNPFAKGFRENGLGKSKRKVQPKSEDEEKPLYKKPCYSPVSSDSDSVDSRTEATIFPHMPTPRLPPSITYPICGPSQPYNPYWWRGYQGYIMQRPLIPNYYWHSQIPSLNVEPTTYIENSISPVTSHSSSSNTASTGSGEQISTLQHIHRPWLDSGTAMDLSKKPNFSSES